MLAGAYETPCSPSIYGAPPFPFIHLHHSFMPAAQVTYWHQFPAQKRAGRFPGQAASPGRQRSFCHPGGDNRRRAARWVSKRPFLEEFLRPQPQGQPAEVWGEYGWFSDRLSSWALQRCLLQGKQRTRCQWQSFSLLNPSLSTPLPTPTPPSEEFLSQAAGGAES